MTGERSGTGALERTLDVIPPAAGAAVMGTGIVSVALSLDSKETLSRVILGIATVIWVTLGLLVPLRAARDPAGFRADTHTPAAFTAAVATAVLGIRVTLLGWAWAGSAALVIAFALWSAFLRPVLACWKTPTVGVSLLLAVSTESLAVLAATLAASERADWLLVAAAAPLLLGVGLYGVIISRFDIHQLVVGRGDHWIAGGALGISALATARIATGARALGWAGIWADLLADLAVALWLVSVLWLAVLLFAEARWPRLQLDAPRWSTVFPIGMYAASSFAVGGVANVAAITIFARAWVWIALAFWLIVFVATISRVLKVVRGTRGTRGHEGADQGGTRVRRGCD